MRCDQTREIWISPSWSESARTSRDSLTFEDFFAFPYQGEVYRALNHFGQNLFVL